MRVIGLIGGMSWPSTAEYYRLLNEGVRDRLGGHHSARIVLYSVDFAEVEALQQAGDWAAAGALLGAAARAVQRAGAELVLLCCNTMYVVAEAVQAAVDIPLLHIVDCTADRIRAAGLTEVGLLGTRFTMRMPFYTDRMTARGITVLTPAPPDDVLVDAVIFDELVHDRVEPGSRDAYRRIIADLAGRGAAGVVFGCTEIAMLVGPADSPVPVFDSTAIHVQAALDHALA